MISSDSKLNITRHQPLGNHDVEGCPHSISQLTSDPISRVARWSPIDLGPYWDDSQLCVPGLLRVDSFIPFDRLPYSPERAMDATQELKDKTRDLRKGLLATTVLVDASVATCSEWLTVVTDYIGPQLNHISGKFLDHQVRKPIICEHPLLTDACAGPKLRLAFVTYGLSSTRPSPILCKRYFSKIETLKRDSLEIPELVGLGQVGNEESERDGMAMLDAFASALEVRSPKLRTTAFQTSQLLLLQMFDLLDTTPNSNSTHILRKILHVAAYPPDNTRHPAWNVKPNLDHLSWSNLPQELRKVRTSCPHILLSARSPDPIIAGYSVF